MATYTGFVIFSLFFSFLFYGLKSEIFTGEDSRNTILYLHHILDSGKNAEYTYRGTVSLPSLQPSTTTVISGNSFTANDKNKLKALVRKDGFYKLRVSRSNDTFEFAPTSFIKACAIYEAELQDNLTIYLDPLGEIYGISLLAHSPPCQGFAVDDQDLNNFMTKVEIKQMDSAPAPETAAYVQKVEREKAEKLKGDHADNRSFLAKYWMYIVPVVIFVLLSSAASPEGGGGH